MGDVVNEALLVALLVAFDAQEAVAWDRPCLNEGGCGDEGGMCKNHHFAEALHACNRTNSRARGAWCSCVAKCIYMLDTLQSATPLPSECKVWLTARLAKDAATPPTPDSVWLEAFPLPSCTCTCTCRGCAAAKLEAKSRGPRDVCAHTFDPGPTGLAPMTADVKVAIVARLRAWCCPDT